MDLCRNTLPADPYFSDVSETSNMPDAMPGAMPTLVVGMWEMQADCNQGHASVPMAPASKSLSRWIWSGIVANRVKWLSAYPIYLPVAIFFSTEALRPEHGV